MLVARFSLFLTVIFLCISQLTAQEYFNDQFAQFENRVYKESIKTVKLEINKVPLSYPIINLNGNEQLKLSFDDLSRELNGYNYTFVHCDANWQQSDLFETEYIDGITEDYLSDYNYSRNTQQPYIHHNLIFPSENMMITKSGNYVIKVFAEGHPDSTIITQRFMVTESIPHIEASVFKANDPTFKFYNQELRIELSANGYLISNPYDDLKVTVLQNGRWDNAKINTPPMFVKGEEIEYSGNKLAFEGHNQFRVMDFSSLSYVTERVQTHLRDSLGYNHTILRSDPKRAYKVYLDYMDINGKFNTQSELRIDDPDVDGDYTWVHFSFPSPYPFQGKDMFVFGELSNWKISPDFKLNYNNELKAYEGASYLKQGYYNYEYVLRPVDKNEFSHEETEGNHSETENDYIILVYHKTIENDYDRLIGTRVINSYLKN